MKQVPNKLVLFLFLLLNLLFFKESLTWFYSVLIGLHDLFNTVFFLLLLFFIIKNTSINNEQFCFSYRLLPLIICCLSVFGYYIAQNFIQINILSFIFLLIYLFGFLGFFIPNNNWKKYLIPLCLIMMMLPFGSILDLYVGFPLRITSVNLVAIFLEFLDINYLSIDTIITIENNSSQVDFSCSGIKGLWAALIFYFTNTWLKNYKIGFKWFLVGTLLMALIVLLNSIRILILVYFDLVVKLPNISDIIHVPLGILGFVFSCTITYFLSGYLLINKVTSTNIKKQKKPHYHFNIMFLLLPLLQIALSFTLNKQQSLKQNKKVNYFDISFTQTWNINDINLSTEEDKFIKLQGGKLNKFSFLNGTIKGTGFVLKSETWRSHHNPEQCITSGGREIIKSKTLKINSNNTIKEITLDNHQQGYYWFQNKIDTTDDFGTRVWNEIFHQQKDWFLVCLIFNSNKKANQKEEFIKNITTQLKNKL